MVAAHALNVYLVGNPAPHGRPPREVVHEHVPPAVHLVPLPVNVFEADRRQRW
jgi:hypothetical protein